MDKNLNFLIVGLGLIGGSIAKGLRHNSYRVYGIDINKESIKYAKDNDIILNNDETDEELIKSADVIILGLYPSVIVSWVKEHASLFKDDAIITDVTGIKGSIVSSIQDCLTKGEFIAMHPMAGKEVSGVQYASHTIFKGANLIIVPTERNTPKAVQLINDIGETLKFKHIEILTIEEHDKMISFLSQLPHAIAVALMCDRNNDHLIRYTGDSFRDLTRIAKINADLWSELFIENKDNLVSDIDSFIATLNGIKTLVQNEDSNNLKKMFKISKQRRTNFDK